MKKWALVTGASGGIGQAIAKALATKGYNLYLHYYQNLHAIQKLAADLTIDYKFVHADLSSSEGVFELIEKLDHPIEVLILNAGASTSGLITDVSDDEAQQMVQLHMTSPFLITKYLVPSMIKNKHGKIVVISSIWGLAGASYEVLYSMVKGGQNTFVKALAKELAPSGINVNGVAPGPIETKMMEGYTDDDKQLIRDEIPMGRFGKPDEIAHAVLFLISDHSTYINGQILSINGAWYT